jgi:transcriptional regulator with XRE-family HTH domain
MIAPSIVKEVRRLLTETALSQRKIARLTGVSRGTVGAIASGKRPDYDSLRRTADDDFPEPTGPPRRCSGCGGMVHMPCRVCYTRNAKTNKPKSRIPSWLRELDEPLELDLRGEHRKRYTAIHLRKAADRPKSANPGEPWDSPEAEDEGRELEPTVLWDAFESDDGQPDDEANLADFSLSPTTGSDDELDRNGY